MFERDVAMAKAQDAQHWRVDAKLTRAADGTTLIDITAHDGAGAPVSGVAASAQFARPTNRRLDRTIMVGQTGPGHFVGNTDLCRRPMGSGHRVVASRRAAVPFEESRRSEIVALK
jgi:nitrogen fixation protein FixH